MYQQYLEQHRTEAQWRTTVFFFSDASVFPRWVTGPRDVRYFQQNIDEKPLICYRFVADGASDPDYIAPEMRISAYRRAHDRERRRAVESDSADDWLYDSGSSVSSLSSSFEDDEDDEGEEEYKSTVA